MCGMAFSTEKNRCVNFTGVDAKMGPPLIAFKIIKGKRSLVAEIEQIQDILPQRLNKSKHIELTECGSI